MLNVHEKGFAIKMDSLYYQMQQALTNKPSMSDLDGNERGHFTIVT
jgi:hypothetical protein